METVHILDESFMIEQKASRSAADIECKCESVRILKRASAGYGLLPAFLSCRYMTLKRKTERKKCKRCSPHVLSNEDRWGLGTKNPERLL
jgi:hypothetical protein